ncbi:hypothetical protein P003_01708 [Enterococcus faecalis EnGen0403]|uniref:hypothetical protein n=1 Tax=Enterococcus faecalis TaxID=1351 RepID=UPI00032FEEB1|nr:hypothetical protein [Enterococcus faecalis]EGO2516077.1 hypothetical protein [Enterococcus faecalis]EGO8337851.1 hypothetical protein [Enterococcus faecalis]EHG5940361.1 hypothetical protein [Enterococcus faecalis]EJZ8623839.1 hypothetical protein [Enterococcus faecalis]EKL7633400.1 hypothetical protein [Enterococcus faecalis]
MKAKKRPVIIECFVLGRQYPDWFAEKVTDNTVMLDFEKDGKSIQSNSPFEDMSEYIVAYIKTLEGVMKADNGDIIIQGINGEIYPCKPDIFKKTYEIVEE